ncbi:hypothetical protein J2W42_006778 [Rhizobium tibeticum]|nr:hypothetical protein [Rhizobium tibeticum]MDP9813901.1 hypothetical protein [Rhizobium tibeticum]
MQFAVIQKSAGTSEKSCVPGATNWPSRTPLKQKRNASVRFSKKTVENDGVDGRRGNFKKRHTVSFANEIARDRNCGGAAAALGHLSSGGSKSVSCTILSLRSPEV